MAPLATSATNICHEIAFVAIYVRTTLTRKSKEDDKPKELCVLLPTPVTGVGIVHIYADIATQ